MVGKFITKITIIQAQILQQYQQTVDKQGQTHYGFTGDWKIYDQLGFIYYMRDYQFRLKYIPFDMPGFQLIQSDNRIKQNKINKTIIQST